MGDISQYNGGAVVGMLGKNCVGIASDTKLGVQLGAISSEFKKVFKMNNRTLVGLGGLATDILTVKQLLDTELNLYSLTEDRIMRPTVVNNLLSSMLYERRFGPYFVGPVVAGLEDKGNGEWLSVLKGMDSIGATGETEDFIVSGTAEKSLIGAAESFFKPNMNADELFECLSQTLLSAVDRDCLSGWGGEVHILTPNNYILRKIKVRAD